MLKDDPIVRKFSHFLPTVEEVRLARALLASPAERELQQAFCETVQIGGDSVTDDAREEAAIWRFCWQARQEGRRDHACAELTVEQMRQCVACREAFGLNTILRGGPFSSKFGQLYRDTVPFSIHGRDRLGHPVVIFRYGAVDISLLQRLWAEGESLMRSTGLPVNGVILFHMRIMEYLTKVVMAEETKRLGRVVDRSLVIIDLEGLSLRHLDKTLKAFLRGTAAASVTLFPETLHATILANVPWIVSAAFWPVVKQFLHPVTLAKFKLPTSRELAKTLSEFIDFDALPPYLGGGCQCTECLGGRLSGGSMCAWEADAVTVAKSPRTLSVAKSPRTPLHDVATEKPSSCFGGIWKCCGIRPDRVGSRTPTPRSVEVPMVIPRSVEVPIVIPPLVVAQQQQSPQSWSPEFVRAFAAVVLVIVAFVIAIHAGNRPTWTSASPLVWYDSNFAA
eukprot:TRINITY_DN44427_c0_g1_i1.p1 TRINITY_DN44427_c0_g1~~TRINITY_DN44427_c0_g1_i1.p1  ORF type:complete len:450 (+),score=68.23 TRINITY_DN44427_c0_g1_i1:83-1432(+)